MSNHRVTVRVFFFDVPSSAERHRRGTQKPDLPYAGMIFEVAMEKFINDKLDELESADNGASNWEFKQIYNNYVYFQGTSTPKLG